MQRSFCMHVRTLCLKYFESCMCALWWCHIKNTARQAGTPGVPVSNTTCTRYVSTTTDLACVRCDFCIYLLICRSTQRKRKMSKRTPSVANIHLLLNCRHGYKLILKNLCPRQGRRLFGVTIRPFFFFQFLMEICQQSFAI